MECKGPTSYLGSKYCSKLCSERAKRNTPPEKQRGRTHPIAMIEADVQIWKEVPGFSDYEISNDGRLRRRTAGSNSKAGRLMRATFGPGGYPTYGLNDLAGKRSYISAHRLVAIAFLPAPKENDTFVLHRNDNKLDARDCNLRWGSPQENANDAIRNGRVLFGGFSIASSQPWALARGEDHNWAKLTEDQVRLILLSPESSKTLGERYDVSPDAIARIRRGKTWRHITDGAFAASLMEGALNYASPPPKRRRLTALKRFELLKREDYRCHLCKGLIYPGQAWDVSHEIPIELNGADDDTNRRAAHRKCHKKHTAEVDIPAIAKAKRVRAAHYGGTAVSATPLPCGKASPFKRKMNGTIIIRATGEILKPGMERQKQWR